MKEPSDDELRTLDHEAQSGKSALMYQASPGGIDMNPVYAAGRRAVFRAGRDFERKSLDAARDEAGGLRLASLNEGLTRDYNALLIELSKQDTKLKQAESERDALRADAHELRSAAVSVLRRLGEDAAEDEAGCCGICGESTRHADDEPCGALRDALADHGAHAPKKCPAHCDCDTCVIRRLTARTDIAEQREKEARRTADEWRQEANELRDSQERTRQERETFRRERDEANARAERAELVVEAVKARERQLSACVLGCPWDEYPLRHRPECALVKAGFASVSAEQPAPPEPKGKCGTCYYGRGWIYSDHISDATEPCPECTGTPPSTETPKTETAAEKETQCIQDPFQSQLENSTSGSPPSGASAANADPLASSIESGKVAAEDTRTTSTGAASATTNGGSTASTAKPTLADALENARELVEFMGARPTPYGALVRATELVRMLEALQ